MCVCVCVCMCVCVCVVEDGCPPGGGQEHSVVTGMWYHGGLR